MYGQGTHAPMLPFQQRPLGPPPPPLQPGLSSSQPSSIQQGPPPIPHNVGYSGSFLYQHAPSPPLQVPTSGMLNTGLSYLPPPPPVPQQIRGSTSVPHPYPTSQQSSQWTQNTHHIPRPPPPPISQSPTGPSRPEMFPPSIPPRVLPTPPSQGQTPYRGLIHLPPPPPTSSFFSPAPYGSFVHSAHQDSNEPVGPMLPPPPPPPPPSSPPPLPPSPPPPTSPLPSFGTLSSTPLVSASDLSNHSGSGPISVLAISGKLASASVDTVVVTKEITVGGFEYDDDKHPEGRTSYEAGLLAEEDLYNVEGTKLDLPSPPPKPAEEKVVQKIVGLCRNIARNGPSFEGDTCQKEFGNPEFDFLFGGEPGSEAAIAHRYFEWVKNKCILEQKLHYEERNSDLRPSDNDPSTQINTLMEAGVSHSASDSDMDMEDDITQPNEEQQVYDSFEGLNNEAVMIPKEFAGKLHTPQSAIGQSLAKDAIPGSSGLADRGEASGAFNMMETFDASQCNASAAGSEKFPGELIKNVSPFRLIQDYASDDSSEDDVKPCLEDVSPVPASPPTIAGGTNLDADLNFDVQSAIRSKGLSSAHMAFGTSSESLVPCSLGMPSNALDLSPKSQRSYAEPYMISIAAVKTEQLVEHNDENQESIENADYTEGPEPNNPLDGIQDVAPESVKALQQKENVKYAALPKVDEFGRLVREGASDSDSDERYTGRRGKRGRSGSRSRSPHDRRRRRRRSPLRRKEKRSRSRSWSPKKQRSRSKSPTYRRGTESSGDKMRRDKSQLPQCFDFLRGRCYRGAFCRYMHHESENTDGGRHYRSKQQDAEVPPVSGTSGSLEEIEKSLDKGKVLVPVQQSVQTVVSHQEDESLDITVAKSERSGEVTTIMHETQGTKEEILEPTTEILDEENCAAIVDTVDLLDGSPSSHGVESSKENLVTPQSQASLPVLQNAYNQPSDVGDSSMSGSLLIQTSSTFQNQPPVSAPHLDEISPIQSYNGFSSQTLPSKELHPLVIPFPPSLSQGTIAPPPPQQPGETMQPPSNFPTFYPPMENCPPNQVLLQNQHSYFHVPPNSSWSLPPPPPLPPRPLFVDHSTGTSATATQGYHWLQLQQNQLPPRPSSHMEDFKLNPPPMVNTMSQPFGGPSLVQGNISLQHAPSMRNSSSFQNYPQMQPQQPLYGLQQSGADIHTVNLGDYGNNNSTMTRSTDLIDRNQVSNLSGFGGSRISNHYNPYASTFDLPLTSKFSSNVLKQEKDRALFDGSYILSHVRPDGPGDQYDPLFDSIEPSSNSSKKLVHDKRRETTLSCSGSHKPLDVEENNKRKEVEAIAITTSIKSENDECGETADAEVGDVDNASSSNDVDNASARNLLDEGNTAVGEIEIDQIKTPGKRKKSKDSRSMKHFKVALANFVKEELKSYWRQGILSKEAFKIIVKKIVDKVSGAMKSHHVPKSQSKINHYIDSSQRKLSKLVQVLFLFMKLAQIERFLSEIDERVAYTYVVTRNHDA